MSRQRKSPDTPQLGTDDEFTVQEDSRTPRSQDPDSVGSRVGTALEQMSGSGPEAELDYQQTLRELADDPQAAVATVADIYHATPEDQYMDRWTQVHLLADLRSATALPFFNEVLSTPIPPEKAPDMIIYSTVGEEVMIRTAAVEGVTRIASLDNSQALGLLREHVQHESFSVKRAAIHGYLETAGEGARDELRRVLPEQDHFILDIRRSEVQDVPQPHVDRPSDEDEQIPPPRMPLPPSIEE